MATAKRVLAHPLRRASDLIAARRQMVIDGLRSWGIDQCRLRLIHHGENTVYKVHSDDKLFIARLSRAVDRTPAMVRGELRFIARCAENGIGVGAPVKTSESDLITLVPNIDPTIKDVSARVVSLFNFIPGRRVSNRNITEAFAFRWGATVARIQVAGKGLKQTASARRPEWHEIPFQGKPLDSSMGDLKWFCDEWNQLEPWLRSLPKDDFGLIHADLHEKNIKIHNGEIYTFDFDDSFFGWRAYDLAVIWPSLDKKDKGWANARRQALLEGYRSVRKLSPEWEARIPGLYRLRRFWIASWGAMRTEIPRTRDWHSKYVKMLELRTKGKLEPLA